MRQATTNHQRNYPSPLRVIEETSTVTSNQLHLVNAAWNFAYTALWSDIRFSSKEIGQAKQQIAWLLASANSEKAFISFCERVLLARQYIAKSTCRYIPLPTVWLDSNNKLGFAGTQRWYDDIRSIRESVPAYKTGIRALAEAILEISKEPSASNYRYWKAYFTEHQTPGLLQLLQATALQQLCN
jgi:hypothetical protein